MSKPIFSSSIFEVQERTTPNEVLFDVSADDLRNTEEKQFMLIKFLK